MCHGFLLASRTKYVLFLIFPENVNEDSGVRSVDDIHFYHGFSYHYFV